MEKFISTNIMREKDLKNLSKDQLIQLLLEKDKPKKTKRDKTSKKIKIDTKKLKAKFDKTTKKFEKLMGKREVVMYPKESVSLNEFRKEEAFMADNFNKGSSFASLFKKRLDKIKGKRKDISITIYVDIEENLIIEKKTYGSKIKQKRYVQVHDVHAIGQ